MAIEKEIGECLRARHLTMGTAESCTGGYIAHLITRVVSSSDYFCGGVVSYSNEVKHHVLGVSEESLAQYGAVSRPVVEQMALGAIRVLGCDCAVAASGIAGLVEVHRKTCRNRLDCCLLERQSCIRMLSFRDGA